MTQQTPNYPTLPDEKGYFYETADEAEMGISTIEYENGGKCKRAILPVSGIKAVVRQLKAKDTKEIHRYTRAQEDFQIAAAIVATTFDDCRETIEFVQELSFKDYSRISAMMISLNF